MGYFFIIFHIFQPGTDNSKSSELSLVKCFTAMTETERKELIKKAFAAKKKLEEELKKTKEEMKKKDEELNKMQEQVQGNR